MVSVYTRASSIRTMHVEKCIKKISNLGTFDECLCLPYFLSFDALHNET